MLADVANITLLISLALAFVGVFFKFLNLDNKAFALLWASIFTLILLSFVMLIICFATSDFSVLSVVNNSSLEKPMIFKISAAWGHHEGSMLLWLSAIAFFSVVFALVNYKSSEKLFVQNVLSAQALIYMLFAAFTFFMSNPFQRVLSPPLNGFGLNPILQDVGLAMHPPVLYLGYVGFSLAFSAGIAFLLAGSVRENCVKMLYPCTMLSWSFLTLGIGLGSWWAYRELGWGGYWFWDPVENSSLMPWLAATALIHSLSSFRHNSQGQGWLILNAIMAFSLSMIGTFLVRSGIITSVHSFATDPERGVFILGILSFLIFVAVIIFIAKGVPQISQKKHGKLSLDNFIFYNNIIFFTAAFTVVFGTIYPMFLDLLIDKKISVGAPYFIKIMAPLSVFSLIGMLAFNYVKHLSERKLLIAIAGSIIMCLALGMAWFIALFSAAICVDSMLRYARKKYKNIYMLFAHMAFALMMLGISLNSILSVEKELYMKLNDKISVANFAIELRNITLTQGANYYSRTAEFTAVSKDQTFSLYPETRLYPLERQQTTESAIHSSLFYDLYITIGDLHEQDSIKVAVYFRPFMSFIWISCIMFFAIGMAIIIRCVRK